jgi:glutamate formiminotransferase/formiminotetrahydrofolate cyclodeaminase
MNLTNINVTPIHIAFDEVCKKANERGIRVTGSELVGLIPLNAMLDAGKYFLRKQKRSSGVSERAIIKIAIKSMGLDELGTFDPDKKIIEYVLRKKNGKELAEMSLIHFANETASESPAPGGGSIAAYMGSLGAALGTMVANLSSHKRGWDDRWEEFANWAEKGQALKDKLLRLVDEDTNAFNRIMNAYQLPNSNEIEKEGRKKAIIEATKYAIEIPYQVMEASYHSMALIKKMTEIGLPSSISDAGVGALCARSAVYGAYLNVKINLKDLNDAAFKENMISKAEILLKKALEEEKIILDVVRKKIEG